MHKGVKVLTDLLSFDIQLKVFSCLVICNLETTIQIQIMGKIYQMLTTLSDILELFVCSTAMQRG